jgi:hypothetical protein
MQNLVRQDIIDKAVSDHVKATEAAAAARVKLAEAEKRHAEASRAHAAWIEQAVAIGDTARPVDLERAKAEAAADLEHVKTVAEAAARRTEETSAAHRRALKEAHWPVLQEAARERIAAAADHDAALKALAAAVARSEAAGSLIAVAEQAGLTVGFDGSKLQPIVHHHPHSQPVEFRKTLRTASDERALWTGVV